MCYNYLEEGDFMCDSSRRSLTDNQWYDLFSEQRGFCFGPICNKEKLIQEKNNRRIKLGEGAHIFPLNPTERESIVLNGVEVLGGDVNGLNNIILLCPNCHTYFDKERDLATYREMVNIKKEIIRQSRTLSLYNELYIEDELQEIIDLIVENPTFDEVAELTTEYKDIEDKMDDDYEKYIIESVKGYFRTFYVTITDIIKNKDSENGSTLRVVSSQIRTAYLKLAEENPRGEVLNVMVDWLQSVTSKKRQHCEVVIAYFIQNCEVFSDVST